jgi:hypothetical protein
MNQVYVPLFHIISQKVVAHLYMFSSGVEDRIFGNTYGTSAITHERNVGALLTKVTEGIGDAMQLGTTSGGGGCGRTRAGDHDGKSRGGSGMSMQRKAATETRTLESAR